MAVVDAYVLPIDTRPVLELASEDGAILAVEDNYVGGLGSELAEAAATMDQAPRVRALAVHEYPRVGGPRTTSWPTSTSRSATSLRHPLS